MRGMIIALLLAGTVTALNAQMAKLGIEPTGGTPEAFANVIRRDAVRWAEVAVKTGIKAE